jgi:predicted SnoaL-like aldol condensation-catalyzing enzyme
VNTVSELNKQKARLFIEAVLNEGRLELIDDLVAADYTGHLPCGKRRVAGRDELRQLLIARRLTHPDLHIKIEDEIAEDDRVVLRWRATASSPGTSATADPPRCWSGISVIRLLAGRQVDMHTAVAQVATDVAA